MKMEKIQDASGENSIDKVNTRAILSHEIHCPFKFFCYS